MSDLKNILEQKMDESGLFDYELRVLDLWEISDEEMYSKYIDIIEKRIRKEKTRSPAKIKRDDKVDQEETEEEHKKRRNANKTQPRTNKIDNDDFLNSLDDPITKFLSKGKGKGKHHSSQTITTYNPGRTPVHERDPKFMAICQKYGACYKFATGDCYSTGCKYNHIPRSELLSMDKPVTRGFCGYAENQ